MPRNINKRIARDVKKLHKSGLNNMVEAYEMLIEIDTILAR